MRQIRRSRTRSKRVLDQTEGNDTGTPSEGPGGVSQAVTEAAMAVVDRIDEEIQP